MQMKAFNPLRLQSNVCTIRKVPNNRYAEISMHFFKYRGSELFAEQVPVKRLAEQYGTPLYIYSYNTLVKTF